MHSSIFRAKVLKQTKPKKMFNVKQWKIVGGSMLRHLAWFEWSQEDRDLCLGLRFFRFRRIQKKNLY